VTLQRCGSPLQNEMGRPWWPNRGERAGGVALAAKPRQAGRWSGPGSHTVTRGLVGRSWQPHRDKRAMGRPWRPNRGERAGVAAKQRLSKGRLRKRLAGAARSW